MKVIEREREIPIKLTVNVTLNRIADVICCGMEGGINYWASIEGYKEPKKLTFQMHDDRVYKHIDYAINPGGAVVILDEEEGKTYHLTFAAVKRGLAVMAEKYNRRFFDIVNMEEDADTGDILIQCSLFGEVIYG